MVPTNCLRKIRGSTRNGLGLHGQAHVDRTVEGHASGHVQVGAGHHQQNNDN